jgi:hypothetical protein
MNNNVRDCVLAVVAGLRGEKRAATSDETRDALAQVGSSLAALSPVPLSAAADWHSLTSDFPLPLLADTRPDSPNAGRAVKILESMRIEGVPLREWLSRRGVGMVNTVAFGPGVKLSGPAVVPRAGSGKKLLDRLGRVAAEERGPAGMMFLGFRDSAPESAIHGIVAHEVGHAARLSAGKLRPRLYGGSKILSGVLGAAGLLRASVGREISGREAAGWQAATALAALPMLNEEVQASRIGSRLAGLRGLRRLGAFRGVPSYIAAASVPAAAYGIRKLLNKALGVDKK